MFPTSYHEPKGDHCAFCIAHVNRRPCTPTFIEDTKRDEENNKKDTEEDKEEEEDDDEDDDEDEEGEEEEGKKGGKKKKVNARSKIKEGMRMGDDSPRRSPRGKGVTSDVSPKAVAKNEVWTVKDNKVRSYGRIARQGMNATSWGSPKCLYRNLTWSAKKIWKIQAPKGSKQ